MDIRQRTPALGKRAGADEHEAQVGQAARDGGEEIGVEGVAVDAADEADARMRNGRDVGGIGAGCAAGGGEHVVIDAVGDEERAADLAELLVHEVGRRVEGEIGARLQGGDLGADDGRIGFGIGFEAVGALEEDCGRGNAVDEVGARRAVDPQQGIVDAGAGGGEADLRGERPAGELLARLAGDGKGREHPEVVLDVDDAAGDGLELARDAAGELRLVGEARHAHGDRVDEQHGPAARQASEDLRVEVSAVVIPPVLAAHADDAVEGTRCGGRSHAGLR